MGDNFQAPGVTVREQRAGLVSIRGVATSVGGMIGRSLRGPDRLVRVTSPAMFRRIFGESDPNSYLPDNVNLFFANGGSTLWVKRVLGSSGGGAGNVKASVIIQDTAALATAITATATGAGVYGNTLRLKSTKENLALGRGLTQPLTASLQTSAVVTADVAARVRKGDTIRITDGAFLVRFVVKQVKNTTLLFETSATPTGALTTATSTLFVETFTLTLFEGEFIVQGPFRNLRMSALSDKDFVVTRVNTSSDEAQYTVTTGVAAATVTNDNRPTNVAAIGDLFAGGDEFTTFADVDYIGSAAAGNGLYSMDKTKELRMLAIPGVTGTTPGAVTKALLDYCSGRTDCVAFTSTPAGTASAVAAVAYKDANLGATSFGTMCFPWVEIIDPLSSLPALVSPEGAHMGVCARTDRARGVAKSPAGTEDGRILGVRGVELVLTDSDRELLYPNNINPIEKREDGSVCVMGSRTMENGEYNQLHVRRTMIYLRLSVKDGTMFVLFEPNTAATRARVKRSIDAFLRIEWQRGTLEGEEEDDAFRTVSNGDNNPPEVVNANQLWADVSVRIPRTVENLVINLRQDAGQAAA